MTYTNEFLNEYDLVKEFGEGVDRIYRDMRDAGLPEPEYKQSEFMLYATLKNKTWGIENGSWISLTTSNNSDSGQDSGQAGGQAVDLVDERLISDIITYCSEPRTRTELQTFCKIASRDYFRNHILNPLIEAGILARTIPDKPSSPKQKYVKAE